MTPQEAKDLLEDLLEEDLRNLSAKERTFLYFSQVLEYFQPKRQRTSINEHDKDLEDDIYSNESIS